MDIKKLKEEARILRRETFNEFLKKGEAHLGGSFSIIELLLAIYKVILKENDKFTSNYEITITLKNDDNELAGRKNWSNKILTNSYLESISKEISTLHFHEFKIPSGKYSCIFSSEQKQ